MYFNTLQRALKSTTVYINPRLAVEQLLKTIGNTQPFGTSAALAARYRQVGIHEIRQALLQFCADLGISDVTSSIDELSNKRVLQTSLDEFWDKRQYFSPNPDRDELGRAAAAFLAAQALTFLFGIDSVVNNESLDLPLVRKVMERGAEGLLQVGRAQFSTLVKMVSDIVDWLSNSSHVNIVIVEAPLGNSVPVMLLQRAAELQGIKVTVVEWGCPRNDRALRGRTVSDSAKDFASESKVATADLIVFVDDAITGSRFLKMSKELRKAVGPTRLAAVAMRVRYNPATGIPQGTMRSLSEVDKWAAQQNMPFGEIKFPDLPIFRQDSGEPVFLATALAWGEAALTTGKRKNNLIFYFLDRYEAIYGELCRADKSEARTFLTQRVWSEDTSGSKFVTPESVSRDSFTSIAQKLPSDLFQRIRAAAKVTFPRDFFGRQLSGEEPVKVRTDWLATCVYNEAKSFLSDTEAHCINNAIRALSEADYTAGVDGPPRDHAYGLYTSPVPPGEDILSKKLIDMLVSEIEILRSGKAQISLGEIRI